MRARKKLLLPSLILLAGCATTPKAIDVPVYIRDGAVRILLGAPQRETMAVLADIDHVRFDLAISKGVVPSKTLTAAQLTNGGASASVTFTNLYPGAATVSITAFNSANNSLGAKSATTSIVPGVVTTVPMTLQLN
ncbi:MAG: hypothetical protein ACM3YO_06715 [Bacteroidota bacterium]